MPLYRRCRSLEEALIEMDAGTLPHGSRVVVSSEWWDALTDADRKTLLARTDRCGVRLSADHRISRHFVEISDALAAPLSSEHRL